MLTKNAIRPGCGRGPLAYDYVNLGLEEVSHKARLIAPRPNPTGAVNKGSGSDDIRGEESVRARHA